ncbi:hypothetical protein ACSVBT_10525 [Afipia sp. TerB]|jgi:hypothetical protein
MNRFEPELIAVMKNALAQAAKEVRPDSSTQALMAERILQTAASGVHSLEELRAIATKVGLRQAA